MGMFDTLKCEYALPITDEIENKLPNQNWSEIEFQTKNFSCALDNYLIEEDGEIYVEKIDRYLNENGEVQEKNFTVEKLDWTGEVEFYYNFFGDDQDYWIEFKALVWKGEIKEIELLKFKPLDNANRIQIQQHFRNLEDKEENRKNSKLWKLFKVWCYLVRLPLGLVRYICSYSSSFMWKLEKWLTGGTKRF